MRGWLRLGQLRFAVVDPPPGKLKSAALRLFSCGKGNLEQGMLADCFPALVPEDHEFRRPLVGVGVHVGA